MTKRTYAAAVVLALALGGCDKIPFLSKKQPAADTTHAAAPARPAAPKPAATPAAPPPAQAKPPAPRVTTPAVDEPWTPTDTGTVQPGMTKEQVLAVWGAPATERAAGTHSYLYYRNGCEASCGTFDVVFLENGQVIDAIVRGRGHTYGGVSSSPPDRGPHFTPPAKHDSGGAGL